jgi:hypothetical protein
VPSSGYPYSTGHIWRKTVTCMGRNIAEKGPWERNTSQPPDDLLPSPCRKVSGGRKRKARNQVPDIQRADRRSGRKFRLLPGARIRSPGLKRHAFSKHAVLVSVQTSLPFHSKMAASVLPTPDTSSLPAISSSATTSLATTAPKQEIYTINDLLRLRASGETAHDPIVAYPSSGTNHVYYTPHQV